jgi:alpha-glucosidase
VADPVAPAGTPWHHSAVIYEVYLRSFADGNGDGVGDLAAIRSRLPYLRDLGVDALWITPWYVSPMADGGYDVADYRDIDPLFGTLTEAESLIEAAHSFGLKIILDIVPNHCSDHHPWFTAAVAAPPGSAQRARFWFRPGRGESGELPPNDWTSMFGGPAWTRVTGTDGRPGEWYLHLYAREQPDLNWDNPEVRDEFESILRFWLDRQIDGFRIDVADFLVKDPQLPDVAGWPADKPRPWEAQDGLHDIYRSWRRIIDSYRRQGLFVGEMWLKPLTRLRPYLTGDELHTAFNFDYLGTAWDAARLRAVIDLTLTSIGAAAPWVLSNHDVTRHLTRYGRSDTSGGWHPGPPPTDLALGTRRARAAILLSLALPGGAYLYQGEELGLWEVEDIPAELIADPVFERTGHLVRGRDGCRVPLPWHADEPGFGFGPSRPAGPASTQGSASAAGRTSPWLPQPPAWKSLAADAQDGDHRSMLELYRAALRLRRTRDQRDDDALDWQDTPDGVLAFRRPGGLLCVVNISGPDTALPPHDAVLLTSGDLADGMLPADTAAWLQVGAGQATGKTRA